MFKRRVKRHPLRHAGNMLWPEIGLKRWFRYLHLRIARLPGTPYSIAAGIACGAAISMTPFVGLHFVLSALFAWLIGANMVAGLIGTAVGNPWTFPFIWAWTHKLGVWMIAAEHVSGKPEADELADLFGKIMGSILTMDMTGIVATAKPLLWPMLIGSLPTAIVTWIVFYFPLRRLIAGYQHRRVERRRRREAKLGKNSHMELLDGS